MLRYQVIFALNRQEHCTEVQANSAEMARGIIEKKNEGAVVTAVLPADRQLRGTPPQRQLG